MLDANAGQAPAAKPEADTGLLASTSASSTANAVAAVNDSAAAKPEAGTKGDSSVQPLLLWVAAGIAVLLLAGLVIGYLKFSAKNAGLKVHIGVLDSKLAKLAKENQQLQESILQAKREVHASNRIPKSEPLPEAPVAPMDPPTSASPIQRPEFRAAAASTSQGDALVPVPVPDVAVAKPERQTMTLEVVQAAILTAIASLANDRSSLTEANFVNKVAGLITDAKLKAALLANLEPALFFLCSGARSPQGPELVVYRFKGDTQCSVVPYPSAGRVGQFNRWFENASSPYGVGPVLASKVASGVIGADGNLSVSALGVLA
jgi:hypothetical protein